MDEKITSRMPCERHLEENIDMWIGGGEDHFKNALRISELRWKEAHERGL